MADPSPYPDANTQTGTPRWVKVFGIITIVVVLLFVILMFTRGPGGRGPHTLHDNQEQEIDTTDGGHNPFKWGH